MVDREEIDSKYSVIPFIPQYGAKEQFKWATNIFIAADLSEDRMSLGPYPAITITYNVTLQQHNREFLFDLLSPTRLKDEWVVAYFPQGTRATVLPDGLGGNVLSIGRIAGAPYPYGDYRLIYTRQQMIYQPHDDNPIPTIIPRNPPIELHPDQEIWVCPCFTGFIYPSLTTTDFGKCRYGHTVTLTFRMTAESEAKMNYEADSFDFYDALTVPLKTTINRKQQVFEYMPAPLHSYSPFSHTSTQTPIVEAQYFLHYDHAERQDYAFRGVFMKGLGAYTADNYVWPEVKHRLSTSSMTLTYDQGFCKAVAHMRQVPA